MSKKKKHKGIYIIILLFSLFMIGNVFHKNRFLAKHIFVVVAKFCDGSSGGFTAKTNATANRTI